MLHSVADEHTTADCTQWDEWENYTPTQKDNLLSFAMSNFDALQVNALCLPSLRCLSDDEITRTGSSGHGRLAPTPPPIVQELLYGRTSSVWKMVGFLKTHATLS